MSKKAFGKYPSGESLKKILKSPNYKDGRFQNIEHTVLNPNKVSMFKMLKDFSKKPKSVMPAKELPHYETDLLNLDFKKPAIIWFGHSSYLISSSGFTILVDPVFSGNASPVKFFGKSFKGSDQYKPASFPEIDILLITHDHYDHLDFKTITAIHHKVKKIITPLGVGGHLEYWGADKNKIVELDWWDSFSIAKNIDITATPARHFSGRSLKRSNTLWASYVLNIHGYKIFIGGDSGYDKQFKIIGNKFKGFDLALLECGQYGKDWPLIHMFPEQTIQAARDLNALVLFPVHWAKFVLANHEWNEPIKRLSIAAQQKKQAIVSPMIGQPYVVGEPFYQNEWWNF